ncbi:hypothetical protein ABPG72_010527 [Tetrahymena utriculariae]
MKRDKQQNEKKENSDQRQIFNILKRQTERKKIFNQNKKEKKKKLQIKFILKQINQINERIKLKNKHEKCNQNERTQTKYKYKENLEHTYSNYSILETIFRKNQFFIELFIQKPIYF